LSFNQGDYGAKGNDVLHAKRKFRHRRETDGSRRPEPVN